MSVQRSPVRRSQRLQPEGNKMKRATTTAKVDIVSSNMSCAPPISTPCIVPTSIQPVMLNRTSPSSAIDIMPQTSAPTCVLSHTVSTNLPPPSTTNAHSAPTNTPPPSATTAPSYNAQTVMPPTNVSTSTSPHGASTNLPPPSITNASSSSAPTNMPPSALASEPLHNVSTHMPPTNRTSAPTANTIAAAMPTTTITSFMNANDSTLNPSQAQQVSEFSTIYNNAYVSVGSGFATPAIVDVPNIPTIYNAAHINAATSVNANATASPSNVNAAASAYRIATSSAISEAAVSANEGTYPFLSANTAAANTSASTSARLNVGSAAIAASTQANYLPQNNVILAMQQQIYRLEVQLQQAVHQITETKRERTVVASPHCVPSAALCSRPNANMLQQQDVLRQNAFVPSTGSGSIGSHINHAGHTLSPYASLTSNAQPAVVNPTTLSNCLPLHAGNNTSFNGQPTTNVTAAHNRPVIANGNPPHLLVEPDGASQAAPLTVSSTYGQASWSPAVTGNDGSTAACAPVAAPAFNLAGHTLPVHPMPPPRKLLDLPLFSGQAEDWPIFYAAFTESTSVYNYTSFENNQRLNKCLKGEARDVVKSLLIHPNNVNFIIEQLRFRFGRPEQLIRSQLKVVREVPPISESNIGKLVSFATITKNLAVFLQSIGEEKHLANPTLLDELVSKLPLNKRLDWARHSTSIRPYPTIVNFSDWLTEVASFVQMIQTSESKDAKRRAVLHTAGEPRTTKCIICQSDHKLHDCRRLLEATVPERWKLVKRLHLCFSCLWPGHSTRDCRRRKTCPIKGCSKFHNRLLHECGGEHPTKSSQDADSSSTNNPVLNCSTRADVKLLFRVLPVTLYGPNKRVNTYALLDEGSSITMMDDSLVSELGLRAAQRQLDIQWFGGKTVNEPVSVVNVFVSGLGMRKRYMLRSVHGVANLNLLVQSLSERDIHNAVRYQGKIPVKPYKNVTPKILIGLDHCHLGLPIKPTSANHNGPYAAFTDLGCVIFGPSPTSPLRKPSCLHVNASDCQVHDMIKDYFSVESFGVRAAPLRESADDIRATHILEDTTMKVNGRFQTGLLWKHDRIEVPESYSMALKRLVSIERRMAKDKEFGKAYQNIIAMYVEKNYARKLLPSEAAETTAKTWYLPHFAVVNPQKPGKLRLVFDAAATSHGVSLNSQLLKGPQQYRSLVSVLFHLRDGAVAVCADIQEMFHQVVIRPEDRCAQRFLWRNGDSQKAPDIYEMIAMTFGAACSPCSANYVKVRNALEHSNHDQRAVEAITEHHYVDDYVDSFDSVSEAIRISQQVCEIHKGASFQLRKFRSNVPEIVAALGGETTALSITSKGTAAWEKVLGMVWLPGDDTFTYRPEFHGNCTSVINGNVVPTKRMLLSIIMSIFDPLGLLSHFIITAKLMMREVWKRDLGWDEPVTSDIDAIWQHFRKQMFNVSCSRIPRHYFRRGKPESLQLHIFVDASEDAFAAVAYWRSETLSGDVEVSIVFAKTRSAPLKPLSIPRLELQAALLGSRMMSTIIDEHKVRTDRCVLWSDSRTVLKWIASEHCRYKPFVAHRIAEILSVSKSSDWRWVPTKENVADEATRVNKGASLDPSSRWFVGPSFLHHPEDKWPTDTSNDTTIEDQEELRPKFALLATNEKCFIEFERFSSYIKLKRVAAWVLRFINNCKPLTRQASNTSRYGLTASELDSAERLLCRQVQREVFSDEIIQLKKGLTVPANSSLFTLTPCVDGHELLRVGGRLDEASWLSYDTRHPIILPPKHPITRLIVSHEHSRMKHLLTEATICMIRQRFWIPNLRRVLRGVIARCNICKIKNAKPHVPQMARLPEDRVTPYVRPFTYTGLDYFGPVSVTIGRRTEKRWVALFTCLTMRAIHLEIAHDLSTDACILTLRNFMNRRGVPKRIRSDNGKNFVGVDGELKRFEDVFDCHELQSELSAKSVEWVFNCPENPSAGGAWERMVQCVKRVLRHTMKEVNPREHTFQSLLIEAENIVNSRPLTHFPVATEQEEPLTPNHFLLGSANTAQTSSCMEPSQKYCSLRKQWRIARQMRDRFWKRWVEEYLPTLTRRSKWCSPTTPLQEGDLVLICDPNEPRKEWRRGRIQRTYPGKDGQVRRVDVLTSTGLVQRPASKIAKLDIVGGESSSIHGGGDVED